MNCHKNLIRKKSKKKKTIEERNYLLSQEDQRNLMLYYKVQNGRVKETGSIFYFSYKFVVI